MRRWAGGLALLWLWLGLLLAPLRAQPSADLLLRQVTADTESTAILRLSVAGEARSLLDVSAGYRYVGWDGAQVLLRATGTADAYALLSPDGALSDLSPPPPSPEEVRQAAQREAIATLEASIAGWTPPLAGPQPFTLLRESAPPLTLYSMSGTTDPFINLYRVRDGELQPLTDVLGLFPEAVPPVLSASVEVVAPHPLGLGLLYRARLRDAAGTDYNALYFYDLETERNRAMPFFGKDPVFSPDGAYLVGSRLESSSGNPPLYFLWLVALESRHESPLAPGCNPQWSPDGSQIAYDGHDNSLWQGYVDCFANGEVALYTLSTGTVTTLSDGLQQPVQLIGWLP